MSEYAIELRDVSRVHGSGETTVHALRGVSLSVAPGTLLAVMGPSGSGKSTLLQLAGGLDRPSEGSVHVEGVALGELGRAGLAQLRRRGIGYVFQDLNLIPALTAAENVALPRELDGVRARQARAEALTALREVDVENVADRFPDEMSGGQQQRVAIARALITRPTVLFADEPTGNLDSEAGAAVLGLLRDAVDLDGQTTLMVTHDARAAATADRVLYLADGRVVADLADPTEADVLAVVKR